ncbi:MAG TPA: DUF1501 domain-containing protein [Phycisphaerales bacterium]|nr:DUF1501 domain-containing protein [Phycisphaerales bacterium]
MAMDRRDFVKTGAALAAAGLAARLAPGRTAERGSLEPDPDAPAPTADACIYIYLPGGVAQTDTWDPKRHTPYRQGMLGSELLGTCPVIESAADGVRLGAGLEKTAAVMDKGCILRSLVSDTMFGAVHLRAQYALMTGYIHPAGFKAPSMGALVGQTLGRRHPLVPEYIYIGRDIDTSDSEKQFIAEYLGPGFLGPAAAPFMIPDPGGGLATLSAAAGMTPGRLDRRQTLLDRLNALADRTLVDSDTAETVRRMMTDARAMMDSPVKKAFNLAGEPAAVLEGYKAAVGPKGVADTGYYYGERFGKGLLLARRLVEAGARFVQVEYQYGPFKGFDMHESGAARMDEMKGQIDGPIARLITDLHERGMLDRTLVVIGTEFGRTVASAPAAGVEPEGASESHTGEKLVIADEKMYGFHGHFSSCNCMLFFGGGFKRGLAYGKTADRHPMLAVENPVKLIDAHATVYHALGMGPRTSFESEGRPIYITKDGKGKVVKELLA